MKIVIEDGRQNFYQWDKDQRVKLEGVTLNHYVHFGRPDGGAYEVKIYKDGSWFYANVPNIWLQLSGIQKLYIVNGDKQTEHRASLFITPREKPDGYLYTETEILSFVSLDERLRRLEGDPSVGGYATEQWVREGFQPKGNYLESSALPAAIDTALAQAKESGEFSGPPGPAGPQGDPGEDYVLTPKDIAEIAEMAAGLVEVPDSGGNANQTIETVLSVDEVCVGKYNKGVLDPAFKAAIAVKNFVKPFVVSATLTSADYQFAVAIYKNGVYVKTEGWLSNGTVYTFDHATYQYKLYIGQVVGGYVYDFDACRKSLVLTISTVDVLKSYNALEIQSDTERRNTKNAVEYMMRRNYDISYANTPAPIDLTTYVGNNQIVHPKVLYFPNKFGGYMYWMAYTPYPFANDAYENPCVAYSNDGYNWVNIDGNPLDDPGGDGYNSDTHLVYVESTGTLELWYRYVSDYEATPVSEIIYRQTTKDGINWTEKEIVIDNDSGDYVQYLSPAVIHDGSIYKMWAVNSTDKTINYYESEVASPAETIALDDAMSSGAIMQNGNVNTSTDYMHTERIILNSTKSFQLTGVNLNGVTLHPQLRYVTAYDADGNVLADYSLQNIAQASASEGRTITMDDAVDSVIISIYKASNYTNKTITLHAVEGGELNKVHDITLNYQDEEKVYKPWHIDVIEDNGKTVLLVMCKCGNTWSLFLATSEDNETFTTPELVMVGNPYGWDTRLYRSCIVNVDGEYRIYYSAQDEIQKYGLGVSTSNTLSNFVGKW